jgi:rRNA maturation endonuclease Nob1
MTKKVTLTIKTPFSLPSGEMKCQDCKKTWFEDNAKKCAYCGSKKIGAHNG